MGDLKGRVALVTGGSRGIGRAICEKLASLGARVFVNYAGNAEAAQETVNLCKAHGVEAEAIQFDVSSSEAVDAAVDHIKAKAGGIDILVNNAGISKDGLLIRLKNDDWDRTLDTNLAGTFYCARACSKLMMKNRAGKIVNISSVVGEMGNPGQVPYVASKAGLLGMTKAMAKELGSRNINVNAITPGFIDTEMTSSLPEATRESYLTQIPLGRLGKASEVASLVAFLVGDESEYITGQVLGINGGMYM